MAIVLRSTKDSALTFAEMDGNFTDLDTRVSAIDSAFIKNIAGTDSAAMIGVINSTVDSAYVHARADSDYIKLVANKAYISANIDSSAITNVADSSYIKGIADAGYITGITDSAYLHGVIDSSYIQLILGGSTTDNLPEGSTNQYYTDPRVDARINAVVGAAYVQARQANFDFLDTGEAINIFDSAYVNARVDPNLFTDSAEVSLIADSAYVQLRQDKAFASLTGKPTTIDGYGITDAFKRNGSLSMLGTLDMGSQAITNATTIAANTVNANVNSTTVGSTNVNTTNLDVTGAADFGGATITGLDITDSAAIDQMIDSSFIKTKLDLTLVKTNILPNADSTLDIGSPSLKFKDLYLSGSTIHLGGIRLTTDQNDKLRILNSSGVATEMEFKDKFDSATTQAVITEFADSDYVRLRQKLVDSAAVLQLVDSAYILTAADSDFVKTAANDIHIKSIIDAAYIQANQTTGTDTLAAVTARGASTSTPITLNGNATQLTVNGTIEADSFAATGLGFARITSASDIQLNATGVINALNNKITNLGTPTSSNDAAHKNYVDTTITTKSVEDFIMAELSAQQTTNTTGGHVVLNNTPIAEYSPNVTYAFSGTEAISTDTAGYYKIETTVSWYKGGGNGTLKVAIQSNTGGGFVTVPGGTGNIYIADGTPNNATHNVSTLTITTFKQLANGELIRIYVDQMSGTGVNNSGNYISSAGISGSGAFPGVTTLKIMKVG